MNIDHILAWLVVIPFGIFMWLSLSAIVFFIGDIIHDKIKEKRDDRTT